VSALFSVLKISFTTSCRHKWLFVLKPV